MRNINKKYHYLYKTTNLINNKYYYGMHSTNNIEDDYLGSGIYLRRAIRKYGKDNFKREIIEMFDTREELIQAEINLITNELLNEDLCMNLTNGGFSGFDYINNLRKTDEEFNKKWIKIQSDKLKKLHKDGKINYNTFEGKTHSDDTKNKMSEKAKQRIGNKNSSFGTCWITKDNENKKIKKEELDQYINIGWSKGRKTNTK